MNEKELTPLQKEIDTAFHCISIIEASGDAVDLIATARLHLRKAFEMAGEKAEGKAEEEKTDAAMASAKAAAHAAKEAEVSCDG